MMRHQYERGSIFAPTQPLQELQKVLAGSGIKSGTRFIENQQSRIGHQRAGDQHPLPFALGQHAPRPLRKIPALDLPQQSLGADAVGAGDAPPQINHRILAADDGFERGFGLRHHLPHAGTDEANLLPQLAPVGFPISLPEQDKSLRSWASDNPSAR
jgi:hypothetical protein